MNNDQERTTDSLMLERGERKKREQSMRGGRDISAESSGFDKEQTVEIQL